MDRLDVKQGERYGRLTVVKDEAPHVTKGGHKLRVVLCNCDCGNTKAIILGSLRKGVTKSCGCLRKEMATLHGAKVKHGARGVNAQEGIKGSYGSWRAMNRRCCDKKREMAHRYVGRGIMICERWGDFNKFYFDMGDRPKDMTLDRVDNDKGYEPQNCKWSTHKEQANNRS
jgi:hypothetical protein